MRIYTFIQEEGTKLGLPDRLVQELTNRVWWRIQSYRAPNPNLPTRERIVIDDTAETCFT